MVKLDMKFAIEIKFKKAILEFDMIDKIDKIDEINKIIWFDRVNRVDGTNKVDIYIKMALIK